MSAFPTRTGPEEQRIHGHPSRAAPARSRRWGRPHLAALVGLLLAVGVAVAACGGGNTSGVASLGGADQATATTAAGGSSDRMQEALAFARCMRQHGINLSDPQISGDMIVQDLGDKGEDDPKVKAAQQACKQHLPNGGQPQRGNPQQRQKALAFARCLRQHGINMPDPTFNGNDITQQLPRGVRPDDSRLSAAAHACHQYGSLPPSNGPQSSGGGK